MAKSSKVSIPFKREGVSELTAWDWTQNEKRESFDSLQTGRRF